MSKALNDLIANEGLEGFMRYLGVTDFGQNNTANLSTPTEDSDTKIIRNVPGDTSETVKVKIRVEGGEGFIDVSTTHNGDMKFIFKPDNYNPGEATYSVVAGVLRIMVPKKDAWEFDVPSDEQV